jgi:hypothetical protein
LRDRQRFVPSAVFAPERKRPRDFFNGRVFGIRRFFLEFRKIFVGIQFFGFV